MLHQTIGRMLSRVVPQTKQTSYIAVQSRIASTRTFASHASPFRSVSRPLHQPQSRTFSSCGRRCRNGNYNRFSNSGRGPRAPPLMYHLLSRARTEHFVIIGLGASAFYYYNTEVVEVSPVLPVQPRTPGTDSCFSDDWPPAAQLHIRATRARARRTSISRDPRGA